MAAEKNKCSICRKQVAKSAKALSCWGCNLWNHIGCADLDDDDYTYMAKKRPGVRWYCGACDVKAQSAGTSDVIKKVEEMLNDGLNSFMEAITPRLDALEVKVGAPTKTDDIPESTFATILKQSLDNFKKETEAPTNESTRVEMSTKNQVLIVKPKDGKTAAKAALSKTSKEIEAALKSIPVSSCKETKTGALVVKLPTEAAKADASTAITSALTTDSIYQLSEPKKMLPKMTITGMSLSMNDDEIIPSILEKNDTIKSLVEAGNALSLLFTKTNNNSKYAVLKMSPDVRSSIVQQGNFIYAGLTRCRAYDRFWVTRCYHCQRIGHTIDKCPMKNDSPTCAYCAASHKSKDCNNKDSPKCINCCSSKREADVDPAVLAHFASSTDCPAMSSEKKRLIENTNFAPSKN